MAVILSRPKKLDHVDTIRYEIDMLRFAYSCLEPQELTERDAWVYLESFLLHYRSLIEFLGKNRASDTDLHVTNIWQLANLPAPVNLDEIYQKGRGLLAKYEPSDAQGGGRISQYLQHCTIRRKEPKDWEISVMMSEIDPLLAELEKHLSPHKGVLPQVLAVPVLTNVTASTTVATMTTAAVRMPDPDRSIT